MENSKNEVKPDVALTPAQIEEQKQADKNAEKAKLLQNLNAVATEFSDFVQSISSPVNTAALKTVEEKIAVVGNYLRELKDDENADIQRAAVYADDAAKWISEYLNQTDLQKANDYIAEMAKSATAYVQSK